MSIQGIIHHFKTELLFGLKLTLSKHVTLELNNELPFHGCAGFGIVPFLLGVEKKRICREKKEKERTPVRNSCIADDRPPFLTS